MKRIFPLVLLLLILPSLLHAARAKIKLIAQDPYASAMVIDADTGETLYEENSNAIIYPASVLKLMDLLIVLEQIEQGRLHLDEMVQVTAEAAKMGGSQVYLDPKEQFSVEDLLYALMVQSANDAAVALAVRVAGSKAGFIALMNKRAQELGMVNTQFHSVHGLPPSQGQGVDKTTAQDLSILCRELANKPEVFKYTSTMERDFRDGKFIMRTHNHLLKNVYGCDGFKTGFFQAAGFSIAATAKRNGVRIIALVLGSQNRKVRDAKAIELLEKGFAMVPPRPVAVPSKKTASAAPAGKVHKEVQDPLTPALSPKKIIEKNGTEQWKVFLAGVAAGIFIYGLISFVISRRSKRGYRRYRR
jgi:D-alanyl-D-alanine carboxypeptidase (penicillin-binding protein 5/6)